MFWYFVAVLLVPGIYFFFTQPADFIGRFSALIFLLGIELFFFGLSKNFGKTAVFLLPLMFFNSFQIVLFYIYGADPIGSDMFLNLITTNSSEVDELLGSILPSIGLVLILYIPILILGTVAWIRKERISTIFRRSIFRVSIILIVASVVSSFFARNNNGDRFSFKNDVYPVNVLYNLGFAVRKAEKVNQFPETSKGFTYGAMRTNHQPQIVVLVIGETGRADNWGLYGYHRNTTPLLRKESNLVTFRDALTQSDVTHKSVSIILSDTGAKDFSQIYYRKGIFEVFKEAGFKTFFLSNQDENFLIKHLAAEADVFKSIRKINPGTGDLTNPPDGGLLKLFQEALDHNKDQNLFIVLHTYGSHFKYTDRYPKSFDHFRPNRVDNVRPKERKEMVNGYDNTIRYTDFFLSKVIDQLKQQDKNALMLYSSDHGEDLFDDSRNRFLHASPTPTYYQLRIPFLMWFSDGYIQSFPLEYQTARKNWNHAVSTHVIFHTLADAAAIQTPYLQKQYSLVNPLYKSGDRLYLTDHDRPVWYMKLNLKPEDYEMLKKNKIKR